MTQKEKMQVMGDLSYIQGGLNAIGGAAEVGFDLFSVEGLIRIVTNSQERLQTVIDIMKAQP